MFNWDDPLEDIRKQLEQNLDAACIYAENKIKEALNVTQPYEIHHGKKGTYIVGLDPSKPGEPPHKRIGVVQKSVSHEVDKEALAGKVGVTGDVSVYLELGTSKMLPRPYIRPTLDKESEAIAEILARPTT